MIESLADIMSDFGGDANRVRCLAHIVNLVVKIILRQFDVSKKKKKNGIPDILNDPDLPGDESNDDEVDEIVRVLDKEEKEMDEGDDGDDEESETLMSDVEKIEDTMEDEVKEVRKEVKPVREVLYKVAFFLFLNPFFLGFLRSYLTTVKPPYLSEMAISAT